ncbi:ABC transporter permease [Agilicoccus flavus]|uniref:ABC transporter permease n=1 Tax=Agilicoccus flavus TaxID=2775968 RepID=UPI001CF69DEB|nr:ABC transporter permease [Agilicoccus flavus]
MTTTATPAGSTATPDRRANPRLLVGLVLGIPTVIALMLLAFAAPAIHSGATDLPLAVSGPAPVVAQLTGTLEKNAPGTFDVTTYGSADEAAAAIRDREAVGGLAAGPTGLTIQTAAGAGAPYAALLRGMGAQLSATGRPVTYTELAPLPASDPAGAGLTTLGLPLIFGGMATAAALVLAYRGSVGARLLTLLAVAAVGGLAATAILQFGFGVLEGDYLLTSAAVAAGIAAVSATVLGLGLLLGTAGIGLGAVLMLFVANPISGLATGPAWLPQPWGQIGQFLPLGAAGTALRSAAYFDGAGAGRAWMVLACWIVGGLLLAALAGRRTGRR